MRNDEITSLTHAISLQRHAEEEYASHIAECVTCRPGHHCSIAARLNENAKRLAAIRTSLESEQAR